MARRDVIAIGGSLGAVDAVRRLLRDLPGDLRAAIAIAIHVGAEGNNLLASVFDSETAMSVGTAEDGETMQPGRVYVAPADRHLLAIDGVLRLGSGPRENMARPAIDPLFRSVAVSHGPRAIAVVLTGMLNDGASGLADVKRCGGVTVVQSPADAVAADMPWSALQTADVDFRAPISDMAALLVKLVAEEAGPTVEAPPEINSEVRIALGRRADSETIAHFSDPAALARPACGGVLDEVKRTPLRFRCQVGHAYTAGALASVKEGALHEAIRVALRIMEERTLLAEKMAEEARRAGRSAAARSYDRRAGETRDQADVLRRAIGSGG